MLKNRTNYSLDKKFVSNKEDRNRRQKQEDRNRTRRQKQKTETVVSAQIFKIIIRIRIICNETISKLLKSDFKKRIHFSFILKVILLHIWGILIYYYC